MCIKMRAEMWNLNPQLVCALEKQHEVFRLVCLSALYTEAKNDMYKCSVHILLLSSWGNDCNQSDLLCSGKTKKLHAERYSHVISVMQWAMIDN